MASIAEVEKLALDDDVDEGVAEALRRDAEMDANPQIGTSLEELDAQVRDLRS